MPRVSLGLPVYNGENYLREAIESLLAQTYRDFELIICDNASTDSTEAICRGYAEREPRIRYHRNEKNVGAAENFNLSFRLSSGPYFKWAAHDDLCLPQFLEEAVRVLDGDESVVLCYSRSGLIDRENKLLEVYDAKLQVDTDDPCQRLRSVLLHGQRCYEVFGLIRRSALERTNLMGNHSGGDNVLLYRLALLGRWRELPECLFHLRKHAEQSTQYVSDSHAYTRWFRAGESRRFIFPGWRYLRECWRILDGVPLTLSKRLACHGVLLGHAVGLRRRLLRDLRVASETLIFGSSNPKARRRLFAKSV
jgi:glycosyltransferase involved in cell wall biosynthesis